jgi:dTDP-4-dehydrorhamnose reductase
MKILLFGKNGQLGWELQRSLASLGELIALDKHSTEYCGDLSNLAGIAETLYRVCPDIIVNAAAYTAVDKAEDEVAIAHQINSLAPATLAEEARRLGAWLIHYSTDYVFDGSNQRFWQETDSTSPLNVYGSSKLAGEQAIRASGCQYIILRTSWVFATRGANFVKTMLRLAQEREHLQVIDNQIGAPTSADLLADCTSHIIKALNLSSNLAGLYHLTASGHTSWYDYACFVIDHGRKAGLPVKISLDQIEAISAQDFPTKALRPENSRLDTSKLQNSFGLYLPPWQNGVSRVITEIIEKVL